MQHIERKDGYVYLVTEHDVYGRHITRTNLGKDPDSPMWAEELKGTKQTRKKKSED